MKPQSGAFLEKADELLTQADTMLGVGLTNAAGRTAYLAGFHAAQALIFERTGKPRTSLRSAKTSAYFLDRATISRPSLTTKPGPGSKIPEEKATAALAAARVFVARLAELIGRDAP